MTESIIIYRNPLEQQLWEGAMSGSFFPFIVAGAAFIAAVMVIDHFYNELMPMKYKEYKGTNHVYNAVVFLPAIVLAILIVYFMYI